MATDSSTLTTGRTTDESTSKSESLEVDPRYEVVETVAAGGHLDTLVDPWIEMQYPLNRDSDTPEGTISKSNRWRVVHHPDGSGVVESGAGSRLYAIRTANGTVVAESGSQLFFPYRSAYHQRKPDDSGEVDVYDYDWFIRLPFEFVGAVLTEFTDLDMHREDTALARGRASRDTWVEGEVWLRGVVDADLLDDPDERGVLLTHHSGVQVYIGWDSTSWDSFELFGFVPFDGEQGVPAPSADDALDLLRPNAAAAAVDSQVARQGEWFLVPTDADPDGTIQKPGLGAKDWRYTAPGIGDFATRHAAIGAVTTEVSPRLLDSVRAFKEYASGSPLDSHLPRDWRTAVDDETFVGRFCRAFGDRLDVSTVETPQDCVDLLYEHEDMFPDDEDPYETVRAAAEGIFVRGTLRHRNNEHRMAGSEEWRRATTHEWDVMTQDGQQFQLE